MSSALTDVELRGGRARQNAMDWAMQTAKTGEDPVAILARAELYADFLLGGESRITTKLVAQPLDSRL